jgi:uncharacterized protein (TIGR02147 family)
MNTGRDYRQILKERFSERCAHNPQYSLRAFARDIKIAPAQLSLVLSGKKGLSAPKARQIAKALGLNENETQVFCSLVDSAHARSKAGKSAAQSRLAQLELPSESVQLQLDAFRTVSDWYHFAILQLMRVDGWHDDPKWIASQLRINAHEVPAALERLERLELIRSEEGRYTPVAETVFTTDGVPSEALRKFHRQVLDKAAAALAEQSLDRRYFNTTVLAIDEADLPKAKARIKALHQEFMNEFSEKSGLNRVYCLAVQLFDLGSDAKGERK